MNTYSVWNTGGDSQVRKDRVCAVVEHRLAKLGFANHPAMKWAIELEGYHNYTFGCRAGLSSGFANLCHELAHAVEFGADNFATRAREGSFVFKVRHVTVLGHRYVEFNTSQPTLRECRVGGIQKRLMRAAGYKFTDQVFDQHYIDIMEYMSDWYMVKDRENTITQTIAQAYEQ